MNDLAQTSLLPNPVQDYRLNGATVMFTAIRLAALVFAALGSIAAFAFGRLIASSCNRQPKSEAGLQDATETETDRPLPRERSKW